jgi:hypothetical protein
MSSRRRITVALVGLVLLAVVGWLVRGATDHHAAPPHPVPVVTTTR